MPNSPKRLLTEADIKLPTLTKAERARARKYEGRLAKLLQSNGGGRLLPVVNASLTFWENASG